MNDYVLASAAELDLDAIWEYIAVDNVDAADRWIAKLFDAFEAIAKTPGSWVGDSLSLAARSRSKWTGRLSISICSRRLIRRLFQAPALRLNRVRGRHGTFRRPICLRPRKRF